MRDDPSRDVIAAALRDAAINVAAFETLTAALDAIEVGNRCEVLVTKFGFGEGKQNGVSLALMLKMKRPHLKVLFVGREKYLKFTEGIGGHISNEPLDLSLIVTTVQLMLGD